MSIKQSGTRACDMLLILERTDMISACVHDHIHPISADSYCQDPMMCYILAHASEQYFTGVICTDVAATFDNQHFHDINQ